jgi:ABC-2 type transport system ATP-binding protein
VVFSSHVMDTVERLCDHVAIINAGQVVRHGTLGEVCNGRRLEDVFIDDVGAHASDQHLDWL